MTDQWLFALHPDWEIRRPQTLFSERREASKSDDVHLTPSQHHGVLPQQEYMDRTGSKVVLNLTGADNMKHVEPDDFIIHLRSFQGGIEHSTYRGKVSNAYTVLTPLTESADPRFFRWVMKSPGFIQELQSTTNQLRDGQSIGFAEFRKIPMPLPPLEEQRRIADFLDGQTTRIDRLISGRQQQLDSVTEAIGAFAFAAVTGQAWSERMSTHIPWAPDLPVGWGAPRLNQVARMGTGHTPSRSVPEYWVDCDIPWLTTTDVHKFRKDEIDTLDETEIQISELGLANSAAVLHPRGTVALSRTASAGFSIVMGRDMATSQDFATWTCGPVLDNRFVLWCLRAMRRDLLGRLAMGSTHKTIYFPDLMSIRVPLPPMAEQRDAVAAITAFAADARGAKAEIARSIDLLQEFRRSLISATVSGEFDVSAASGRGVPA